MALDWCFSTPLPPKYRYSSFCSGKSSCYLLHLPCAIFHSGFASLSGFNHNPPEATAFMSSHHLFKMDDENQISKHVTKRLFVVIFHIPHQQIMPQVSRRFDPAFSAAQNHSDNAVNIKVPCGAFRVWFDLGLGGSLGIGLLSI